MDEFDEGELMGQEEEELVSTVDTKLGPEENRIKQLISFEFKAAEDITAGNKEEGQEIKPASSLSLKKKLDEEFGGNWNIIIGANFASVLGLLPEDRYGHFSIGTTNILVFETSGRRN